MPDKVELEKPLKGPNLTNVPGAKNWLYGAGGIGVLLGAIWGVRNKILRKRRLNAFKERVNKLLNVDEPPEMRGPSLNPILDRTMAGNELSWRNRGGASEELGRAVGNEWRSIFPPEQPPPRRNPPEQPQPRP